MAAVRRVLLMRHAESRPDTTSDHGRPLTERGKKQARDVAKQLDQLDAHPDRIVLSTSKRTRDTLEAMVGIVDSIAQSDEHLYLPTYQDILRHMDSCTPGETLMIITHNPGCELSIYQTTEDYVAMEEGSCAILHRNDDGKWKLDTVVMPHHSE